MLKSKQLALTLAVGALLAGLGVASAFADSSGGGTTTTTVQT